MSATSAIRPRAPGVEMAEEPDARTRGLDWMRVAHALDESGNAVLPGLLGSEECESLASLYSSGDPFRGRIVMARHGFGRGEYKYFRYPLPDMVARFRTALYRHLAPIANRWNEAMGVGTRYPAEHGDFIARCHEAGQRRPTPLLLRYQAGDYNCLHQDVYGEHVFPLQVAILLSRPGHDFTGGEFVMTEQRPRMQSNLRHGVSRVRSGLRHVIGIIFHDAE